eukprot:Em0006g579a
MTFTSPLCSAILGESCQQATAAALAAEARKLHSNGHAGVVLVLHSISLETYGNWGKEAHNTVSRLASHLAISQSSPKPVVVAEIYGPLIHSCTIGIMTRELLPSWLLLFSL